MYFEYFLQNLKNRYRVKHGKSMLCEFSLASVYSVSALNRSKVAEIRSMLCENTLEILKHLVKTWHIHTIHIVCKLSISLLKYIVCYLKTHRNLQTHSKNIAYTYNTHSM